MPVIPDSHTDLPSPVTPLRMRSISCSLPTVGSFPPPAERGRRPWQIQPDGGGSPGAGIDLQLAVLRVLVGPRPRLSCANGTAMRIGIIGSGNIGATLAELFVGAGHQVVLANSRGPETLAPLVERLADGASAATAEDAAAAGDLVIVSIPFGRYEQVPAGPLAGKVVVDCNNYYPARDGRWRALDADETTSSELLAQHLPGARVVKVFNAIHWKHLRDQGRPAGAEGRRALPIAGDDVSAKATVGRLIDELGFDTVDLGPLAEGRRQQPGTEVYNVPLTAEELHGRLEA